MGCTDLLPYDKEFAHAQQLAQAWDDLRSALDDAIQGLTIVWQSIVDTFREICAFIGQIRACIVPGRVVYLSHHGKTHRVRKKNRKRIMKLWRRLIP